MIGALLANLMAVLRPPSAGKQAFLHLAAPFNWISLFGQLLFYGLAWLGNSTERQGKLGKMLYLPTFLVNSNLAALVGLYRTLTKRQTTLWQRAR
jgi:hypothetical protein